MDAAVFYGDGPIFGYFLYGKPPTDIITSSIVAATITTALIFVDTWIHHAEAPR